ncbi:tyrosine-type recombinase/integrase [Williamsia herbipolensis]|uniref:tyrosine-type recombinase/integrase n=1 Tax=Williamsia herbipolensis TaxID=1603258 RepID=UPI0005F792AA|nr:site-specific integrase [Williamsia herbipolensis]
MPPTPKTRTRRSFGRLRQRSSGRWQASYLHRGATHLAPHTFPTKDSGAAWLLAEQDLIDLDNRRPGEWSPPSERAQREKAAQLTLKTYAERWLAHRNISRRTRDSYRSALELHIVPVLGDHVLAAITTDDVRAWYAGMGTEYPTRNARTYGVLTAVLNTAVDDGLIERSPARIKGASAVRQTKRGGVVLLEPAELSELAAAMPAPLRLAVLLAGWCGMRRGEVFALTRADISVDCATLRITKGVTYRNREYVVGLPKTRESNRTVTVPPHLREVIAAHLSQHVSDERTALLFTDPVSGEHYAEGRFRVPFFAARTAIGKPELHFHDLRHFGGVMAALTGATTREVMDRLGHTTSTAAMRYQHVAAGRADALADRLSLLAAAPMSAETD